MLPDKIIEDLEDLLYVTKFYVKDKKIKKNRKIVKKCIKELKNENYDKVLINGDNEYD